MGRRLRSLRITGAGWLLLVAVPVAILMFVFGPGSIQVPALIIAAVLLLVVIGNTFSWYGGGSLLSENPQARNQEALEKAAAEFDSRERGIPIEEETYDPQGWQRERERRAEIDRERAG